MRDVYAHMLDKGFIRCWRSALIHSNHTLSGYGQKTSSVQNLTVNNYAMEQQKVLDISQRNTLLQFLYLVCSSWIKIKAHL